MIFKYYPKRRYNLFRLVILFLIFNSIIIIFLSRNDLNLKDKNENIENPIDDKTFIIRMASNNPPNNHYFNYYKQITINHEMVSGSGSYTNFPLLISILDEDLHNHVNQSNGNDIAFANDTDWLDHEIEFFNQTYSSTHANLVAWVRIPSLSTSVNTTIYMYYGNSTMNSRQNPTGVWDVSYRGVWHLSELIGFANDSTSYDRLGIVSPGGVSRGATGQIARAYDFGNNGQINYGDPSDGHLDMGTGSFTISFWMNIDDDTGNYQLPLYKGATTNSEDGYDFETNVDATYMGFRICDGTDLREAGGFEINYDVWNYVTGVVDRSSNYMRLYKDGSQVSSAVSISSVGSISNSLSLFTPTDIYDLNGLLDEIRICSIARTAGWILTEYNNQNDPLSFLNIGLEESLDSTPPTYSNLIESSDPLELGQTEVITINVSDPFGINQVKIEYQGTNHSMTNIGGDTWQYDSWTPSSVGNYSYTIWMEDNYHNWNSTMGIIEVIDTTPPTYSNLIESADPLQLGQNETITIKVYDSPGSGVKQVLLEYELSNHTMGFIGGNTWSWSKWNASLGIRPYKIYMVDMENNWNMTSGTITVIETTAPIIENVTKSVDPLELGNNITITVDVFDEQTNVSIVFIELDNINYTMTEMGGNAYEFTWTKNWVGTCLYVIYANDSLDNWNSFSGSFDIVDTTPPAFSDLEKSEDPLELGNIVIISVNCTDLSDINQALIQYAGTNHSMTNVGGDTWQYNWIPSSVGNNSYTIWAEDHYNNWVYTTDLILVQDTTPPMYSDLTESADPVELGEPTFFISINATDLADIKDVRIEFQGTNHTMTKIGDDIWWYNTWMPASIGNYTYTIYITDNNDNLNYVSSSILFQDSIIPFWDNLFENADPFLELGDNVIVRIDIEDIAGINQTLIEFEGANHTMTNIYGDTWQYDSWIPNNWIVYQYTIFMEDKSGNWNSLTSNITVQDTTPPSPPVLTNSPSGDVSGTLVFDWSSGIDPSGISYYILIIDNESDPIATPGYVYIFNTTNTYCELPEILPPGEYHFFLAQVDGVGQQSEYTIGIFTVIKSTPRNNTFLIIGIILASVVGSVTAIVLVRRKLKKTIAPPREKIPLKIISSHINKLSNAQLSLKVEEIQSIADEKEIETHINEIKDLGEELFNEGAYLEAQKQFMLGRDLLIDLGEEEEAKLISDLISGIEGLIEEREKRIELLERIKIEGNSVQVFELYHEIMTISKKLRDPESTSFYQSELIQFFQVNNFKLIDLEEYRNILEQKADSLLNNNQFEIAAEIYEKCEMISQIFIQLERDGEVANFEKFRNLKTDCLDRIREKKL
jgi:hypothetical protein